jgi:hypothetical protein
MRDRMKFLSMESTENSNPQYVHAGIKLTDHFDHCQYGGYTINGLNGSEIEIVLIWRQSNRVSYVGSRTLCSECL